MSKFICKVTLPEETLPSNYDHNKTCKCGEELINNDHLFNISYDIHYLFCPKCKTKYIKYSRTGYLKEKIYENN